MAGKAVIFDLDGTLADSLKVVYDSISHGLAEQGIHISKDEVRELVRCVAQDEMPRRWPGSDVPRFARAYFAYFKANLHSTRLFDGAAELLADLRRDGVKTALFTKKMRAEADAAIAHYGITFGTIVALEDVRRHKPDKEPVEKALAALGVRAKDAIIVGDMMEDIAAGRAAGVRTIGVTFGHCTEAELKSAGADEIAADYKKLRAALTKSGFLTGR